MERNDCPDEVKGVVCEVVDFSSDIQAKRAHDTTRSFPEVHKCEVHHLTFDPKFVSADDINKEGHGRTGKILRNNKVERVLRPDNFVVLCFSQEKAITAYNQTATNNIILIMKHGRLPEFSRCETFIDDKRITGGDRQSSPYLPTDKFKLTEHDNIQPLCPHMKIWHRSRYGCAAQYQGKNSFVAGRR